MKSIGNSSRPDWFTAHDARILGRLRTGLAKPADLSEASANFLPVARRIFAAALADRQSITDDWLQGCLDAEAIKLAVLDTDPAGPAAVAVDPEAVVRPAIGVDARLTCAADISPISMLDHPQRVSNHRRGERAWRKRGHGRRDWIDWPTLKDQINLETVAAELLGDPQKIDGSGRHWWLCPFHPDRNPSFCVTPERGTWKCFGCGVWGDALALVMKLKGVNFFDGVQWLAEHLGHPPVPSQGNGVCWSGRSGPPTRSIAAQPRPALEVPGAPTGIPLSEAVAVVESARERLWSPGGRLSLRWLHLRGLTDATIRAAGLGWTPALMVPTRSEIRYFRASGIVIPWFEGETLRMVKVRQPWERKPKYVEAFRDAPGVYPGLSAVRPGAPLILVEGEFDALLLGQELGELAAVVTVGSASAPVGSVAWHLYGATPIYAAHDADPAGDRAAATWPARVVRVRPPAPDKDWTDAAKAGVNLRRWWRDRIEGIDPPERLTGVEEERLERAAMMEFDGGMSREAANRAAGIQQMGEISS